MPIRRRTGVASCAAAVAMCVAAAAVPAGADVLPLPLDPPARLFAWDPDVRDYHVHVGLAVDREGNAFVSDEATVWKVSSSGGDLGSWTIPDSESALIEEIDISPDGEIFVLDTGNERVLRYSADGVLLDSWAVPGAWYCGDMVIDEAREVYVLDWGQGAIRVFSSSGEALRSWDVPHPDGVALDPNGNLLIAANGRLLRFTTEGQQLQELTWNWLEYGFEVGEIAMDAGGNVYMGGGVLTPRGFCLAILPRYAADIAVGPGGEISFLQYDSWSDWLLKFDALPSGVAITSEPSERPVFLDGVAHTTPLFHAAPPGSEHTYSVHASEEPAAGTRIDFAGWNDGPLEPTRTLVVGVAPGSLHASFESFFRLTVTSTSGGTVSPGSGWYPKDSDIELHATPTGANVFLHWSLLPDPTSICCRAGFDSCCQTRHEESNPITVSMYRARTVEAAFTGESDPVAGNYELSISASDSDPFVNSTPAAGMRNLYLWLTASEPGTSALEADAHASRSLQVLGFSPVGGALNVGTEGDLLLAIPSCPSGEEIAVLLGYWTVIDDGGSLCLQPSEANGILGTVDCRELPALWDVRVLGFASDGPPCVLGPTNRLIRRPGLVETPKPLASPLGDAVTALHAPYPNPLRGESVLSFSLAGPAHASVWVYDVAGRLVRKIVDRPLPAGVHSATWNGRDELGRRVASGTYFVRLETGEDSRTRKVVLLKSD